MARHSNGKGTYSVAWWLIVLAILIVAALVFGIGWLLRGGSDEGATSAAPAAVSSSAGSADDNASQAPASEKEAQNSAKASDKDSPATSSAAESKDASESAAAPSSAAPSSEKPSAAHAPAAPADTLFLLDTSVQMAPNYAAVAGALADTAQALGAAGQSVALWNYSSPLSPTATVGYRDNVGFGAAGDVAAAATQFGTGGVPQTRSAVLAALATARDQANATGKGARVVLVTTGTAQDMDDAAFTAALDDVRSDNVKLSVVQISGDKDEALAKAAASYATASPNDAAKVLATASGV